MANLPQLVAYSRAFGMLFRASKMESRMSTSAPFQLLEPSLAHLSGYADALARGWSPNNVRDVSAEQLAAIRVDREAFVAELLSQTGTVRLPDGTEVPKLPSHVRWMWDGAFAGHIGLRWQAGTDALPDYVLGHIGFAVVPWKRRRGYATRALAMMLPVAREVGLKRVEITTDTDNRASQRVIEANGGRLIGEFRNPRFGTKPKLRYVVDIARQ
jgi:predicted acetyltransferase